MEVTDASQAIILVSPFGIISKIEKDLPIFPVDIAFQCREAHVPLPQATYPGDSFINIFH